MNLVEELLKIDAGKITEVRTKEIPSRRLSELFGKEVKVKIKEIDPEEFTQLSAMGLDEDGNVDYSRAFNANAHIAARGIIEPNLKDESLMRHLGVATPKDAAVKMFKGEINTIASEITLLSGFGDEEEKVKTVKN